MIAFSVPEAGKRIGLGVTKTYEEIAAGRLKAKKTGKRTIVTDEAIDEWLKNLPDYPIEKFTV